MDNELPTLQWKQNGVTHIVKLLPGGRIGSLCEEMLAEIRETGGEPDEKVKAIRRGDVHTVRRLQKPEGKELASAPLHEWEETIQGPSGPFPVTLIEPETPVPAAGRRAAIWPNWPMHSSWCRTITWHRNIAGRQRWKTAGSCFDC